MRRFWILITVLMAACGSSRPSTPSTGSGSGAPASISGRERIGWDQPSADAGILDSLRFALYVDTVRSELTDASCATTATAAGFFCTGQLPSMTAGSHTLAIAAFTVIGAEVIESNRSGPLQVIVSAPLASSQAPMQTQWPSESESTRDGLRLRIEKLAEGLDRPVDAAFAPDGRLFIVDRNTVRVLSPAALQDAPALSLPADDSSQRLLSIAFDPEFERTRCVFVLQTMESREGQVVYLARYREVRGALGQRAILFQTTVATDGDASGVLRFGPDGKIYIAAGSEDASGKVFRLNADGTMPRDQAGTTPAVAAGVTFAEGLAWDPRASILWIVDNDVSAAHLSGVSMSSPPVRSIVRSREDLPPRAGSIVFPAANALPELRNTALVASKGGYILRLRFAPDDPTHIVDSERWLENQVGPVHVVVIASDGTIYFCTRTAVGRLILPGREK